MKFRIYSILTVCALVTLAQAPWIPVKITPGVEAQTQRKDESGLIVDAPIASTITTGQTKLSVKGSLNLRLEISPGELKRGVVTVKALNLAFFSVQQSTLSGKKTAVKYGVLGMSIPPSEKSVQLRYDANSQTASGEIPVQAHYPQIDEIFPPEIIKGDRGEDDFAVSRTQRGKVKIQIKFTEALDKSADVAAQSKKITQTAAEAKAQIEVEPLEDNRYALPGYRLDIGNTRILILAAFLRQFEAGQILCIQPVKIQSSASDPAPTGAGFTFGMPGANTEWAKADVVFEPRPWKTITNASLKVASAGAEEDAIRASVNDGDCIEVFFVENFTPVALHGGGATWSSGTASAKIISSDGNVAGGIDLTHLAHELGHVLNLCHPGPPCGIAVSSTNTLMCPSGWLNDNPKRNSEENKSNISNPLLRFTFKPITPGTNCNSSADCGACPPLP